VLLKHEMQKKKHWSKQSVLPTIHFHYPPH
jgi:hypothetical protein